MDLTRAIQGGMTLAGAFGNGDAVYQQQMSQAAQMEAILAQARMRRDQERARAELGETLRTLGHDPALAGVLNAGHDPREISGYGAQQQITQFRQGALNEALSGNLPRSNAYLAAIDGKPLSLTRIEGNSIVNPYELDGYHGPTAIGQAMIGRSRAEASAADALAGKRTAETRIANAEHAAKIDGRWNPAGRPPGTYTEPSTDALQRAFDGTDERGNPQLDPVRMADFAAWRREYPEYRNGHEALNVYLNEYHIRPQTGGGNARPFIIDGSQPFMESRVTQGQQVPGQVRPDVAPSGAPEPQTDSDRRDFLMAAKQALLQGGDRALIEAKLAQYGLSLTDAEALP